MGVKRQITQSLTSDVKSINQSSLTGEDEIDGWDMSVLENSNYLENNQLLYRVRLFK